MINSLLIGIAGFGRVGKDCAGDLIRNAVDPATDVKVFKFAELVRKECEPQCRELGIDPWTEDPAEKELVRPFFIETGAGRREADPRYWITALEKALDADKTPGIKLVTDVRYMNEAEFILGRKGIVLLLHRRGFGPLNAEEGLHTTKLYAPDCPLAYRPGFRNYWWTYEMEAAGVVCKDTKIMREQRNMLESVPELSPFVTKTESLKPDRAYLQYLAARNMKLPDSMRTAVA